MNAVRRSADCKDFGFSHAVPFTSQYPNYIHLFLTIVGCNANLTTVAYSVLVWIKWLMNKMKLKNNFSGYLLGLFALTLIGVGIFFLFFRPYLLPEDIRYMGLTEIVEHNFRDFISPWLKLVFKVLGGYIVSSGILFLFLARKFFQEFDIWAWLAALVSGAFSIGIMTLINFKIQSDFRWWILLLSLVWFSSIVLNLIEKQQKTKNRGL